METKCGWAYIMASESGTLYTGVTSDIQWRVHQHKKHLIPGFTAKYKCEKLAFFERFETIGFAIEREKEIKGWRRSRKQALIRTINPSWKDLAADWYYDEAKAKAAVTNVAAPTIGKARGPSGVPPSG
jgi:putative endonuclease